MIEFKVSKGNEEKTFSVWEKVINWLSNQVTSENIVIKTIENGKHSYTQWYEDKKWKVKKEI